MSYIVMKMVPTLVIWIQSHDNVLLSNKRVCLLLYCTNTDEYCPTHLSFSFSMWKS